MDFRHRSNILPNNITYHRYIVIHCIPVCITFFFSVCGNFCNDIRLSGKQCISKYSITIWREPSYRNTTYQPVIGTPLILRLAKSEFQPLRDPLFTRFFPRFLPMMKKIWNSFDLSFAWWTRFLLYDLLGAQIQEAMTADEKKKLYDALGYQEGVTDPRLPLEVSCSPRNRLRSKLCCIRQTVWVLFDSALKEWGCVWVLCDC